ncbi:D-alanyl-D-alanine carboxypeptidase/D-alanyl-D-alanine-endopeptidase [Streptomyces sannanensis]|uniref:D-alanyl-D-alanine carboxypeptidase/D-alanyl-D-alanine-endopeptidase n=1 Tax=Streptomyces sannanensis TaxID=285536 RepID=A0ABP6SDH5_9ACTN
MLQLKTWQVTAGSAVLGLVLATGAVTAAGPWDSGQRKAERALAAAHERPGGTHHAGNPGRRPAAPAPAPSAAAVLPALAAPGAVPGGQGLAARLDPLVRDPALGSLRTAAVYDTATGTRLYGERPDRAMTPASTTKIATAVAALSALGPDHRIPTRVVLPPPTPEAAPVGRDVQRVVLVGGGDPTLGEAGLRVLAERTARAVSERGATRVAVTFDTSLYTGPVLHPIGRNPNIAPVVPLMTDEARLDRSEHGPAERSSDPAGDTARAFAALLNQRGIRTVSAPVPGTAPKGSVAVATTHSRPVSALVERMLTNSDNDLAEALARQTALAAHLPASFDGASQAMTARLKQLGLPVAGARFADGSGLNRADRLSADLLTRLLALAADPDHPELRPVLTGLPVAGFSGTLADRYAPDTAGTGLVRAKTGTLTGVDTLAGTVVDADGRLLTFAFLSSGTLSPVARPALDRLASALTTCGCTRAP